MAMTAPGSCYNNSSMYSLSPQLVPNMIASSCPASRATVNSFDFSVNKDYSNAANADGFRMMNPQMGTPLTMAYSDRGGRLGAMPELYEMWVNYDPSYCYGSLPCSFGLRTPCGVSAPASSTLLETLKRSYVDNVASYCSPYGSPYSLADHPFVTSMMKSQNLASNPC
jgi:hypothetical protein